MKITAFNRQTCRDVSDAVLEALRDVEERFGVTFASKGGSFESGSFTMRLEASVVGDDGVAQTRERSDFGRIAGAYGLQASDLDREFTSAGKRYRITGCKVKCRARPILCTDVVTGKVYKFPSDTVRAHLSAAPLKSDPCR